MSDTRLPADGQRVHITHGRFKGEWGTVRGSADSPHGPCVDVELTEALVPVVVNLRLADVAWTDDPPGDGVAGAGSSGDVWAKVSLDHGAQQVVVTFTRDVPRGFLLGAALFSRISLARIRVDPDDPK